MDVNIKIEGLKELEAQLKKLEVNTGVKFLNGALMSAANPALKRAKARMSEYPKWASLLKRKKHRNINRKGKALLAKGFRSGAAPERAAGVSIIMPWVKDKTEQYHLIELGTKERFILNQSQKQGALPKGKTTGSIQARHFMRDSFKEGSHTNQAIEIFKKRLKAQLKKITKGGKL